MKRKTYIKDLFHNAANTETYLKVCAPMVRYSKLQFRTLVRNYGVDLSFTPMILADSFCQNEKARSSEFSTASNDTPLIVQFAANNVNDFVDASQLVYPYADGVDLNCGCPQKWAMKDGYGSALLNKPEVIYSLIRSIKNSLPSDFSVSVKIRLLKEFEKTIDMCKQMEHCGVTFLTVHGRTPVQKSSENINISALGEIIKSVQIPVIVNGGVKTLDDSEELYKNVNCAGVMSASGILSNPALFSGYNIVPSSCVKLWMKLKNLDPSKLSFQCYHHHLVFMLEKVLTKQQKQVFNYLKTYNEVDDYLLEHVIDHTQNIDDMILIDEYVSCIFNDEITNKHCVKCRGCGKSQYYCICSQKYDPVVTDGTFFTSFVEQNICDLDYMDSNLWK